MKDKARCIGKKTRIRRWRSKLFRQQTMSKVQTECGWPTKKHYYQPLVFLWRINRVCGSLSTLCECLSNYESFLNWWALEFFVCGDRELVSSWKCYEKILVSRVFCFGIYYSFKLCSSNNLIKFLIFNTNGFLNKTRIVYRNTLIINVSLSYFSVFYFLEFFTIIFKINSNNHIF